MIGKQPQRGLHLSQLLLLFTMVAIAFGVLSSKLRGIRFEDVDSGWVIVAASIGGIAGASIGMIRMHWSQGLGWGLMIGTMAGGMAGAMSLAGGSAMPLYIGSLAILAAGGAMRWMERQNACPPPPKKAHRGWQEKAAAPDG